jgi:hypothetical protein
MIQPKTWFSTRLPAPGTSPLFRNRLCWCVPGLCVALTVSYCLLASTASASTLSGTALYTNTSSTGFSLRGLALSPDDSQIYGGFIQGASSSARIREIDTTLGNVTNTVSTLGSSFTQPKGVAVDDRGNVYSTLNNSSGSTTQEFRVYDSTLATVQATQSTAVLSSSQLGGLDVAHIGSNYYVYLAFNKGAGAIERYDVTNPAAPALDTSFGTGGILNLRTTLIGNANLQLNGITVASDGTIFVAGDTSTSSSIRGDTLYKINSALSSVSSVAVTEAMDVALYGGNAYVTEYNGGSSAVAVVSQSSMSLLDTITFSSPSIGSLAAGSDAGFSGIDIAPSGLMYVGDQVFNAANNDQIIVAQVPEPASWCLLLCGSLALAAQIYRKHRS